MTKAGKPDAMAVAAIQGVMAAHSPLSSNVDRTRPLEK